MMNEMNASLFDAQGGPLALALLLLLKLTALLAIAWSLHFALRGVNPRWRVLLWRAVSVGVLVVCGLALCPPLLSWAVLPAETAAEPATAEVALDANETVEDAKPVGRPVAPLPPDIRRQRSDVADPTEMLGLAPVSSHPPAHSVDATSADATAPAAAVSPLVEVPPESSAEPKALAAFVIGSVVLWCAGVFFCIVYRLLGLGHLIGLLRDARPVPEWVEAEAARVAEGIALRRRFLVRQTGRLPVPCLASVVRPVILLPEQQCSEAHREEIPAILAHELAHLKGGDLFWSRLLHGLSSLLWFHPLAWRMPGVHGDACDAVCDAVAADYVGDAGAYGCTLARLALRLAKEQPSVGLAMAGKSNVRRRVEAVRRYVFRSGLSRWRAGTVLAVAAAGMLLLGGLALTRSNAASPDVEAAEQEKATTVEKTDEKSDTVDQSQAVLLVRCVADESGEPMEGVRLRFHGRIGGEIVNQTLQTDKKGVVRMEWSAEATIQHLWMKALIPGYTPLHYTWRSDRRSIELPETLELRFEKGIEIGGRVEDEGGSPIAGATVELMMPITWPRLAGHVFHAAELETDESGRWRWDGAPKGIGELSMRVKHPDYLESGGRPAASMENLVVLRRGLQVTGRVVDGEGKPIEGAVAQLGFDRFGSGEPKATTDGDGRFAIKDCEPGRSAVTVQADGYSPAVQELTVGKSTEELEFRLKPGHVLRGRVVDVDGKPIAGAYVGPDTWRGYRTLEQRMKTGDDGRFEWRGAPPDAVEYDILKQGYMSKRKVVLVASEKDQTVTLYPVLQISGRVTDAVTGEPIPEFRIQRGQLQHNRETVYWTRDEGVLYKDGRYSYKFDEPMKGWLLQVVAPEYLPATSRTFESTEGRQTYDFALQRGEGPTGIVLLPDGQPAEDAEVALATGEKRASLTEGRFDRSQNSAELTKTDSEGRFTFPAQDTGTFLLIAVHEAGYGEATSEELVESDRITLKPWGRLEGKVRVGDKPDVGREVNFRPIRPRRPGMPVWNYGYETRTDEKGQFEFNRVIPGPGSVTRVVVTEHLSSSMHSPCWQTPVEIPEGASAEVTIGGTGRPVKGRLVLDREPSTPVDWIMNDPATIVAWDKEKDRRAEDYMRYAAGIDESGRFEIPDVPAGDYRFSVPVNVPPTPGVCGSGNEIGRASLDFSIPEMPGGRSSEPFDLGTIEAKLFDTLDVGELAPEFVVQQLSGEPLRLNQFRGKLILLDFWATWCQPCLAEFPSLKKIHGTFGDDERFVMLSISCDSDLAAPRSYVEENDLSWRQAHVPGTSASVPEQYTVRVLPATFLIAPDGKVLAKDLRGDELKQAVADALEKESLFDVDTDARPSRFPVTGFDVSGESAKAAVRPAAVVLDNTDPEFDRNEPRHDNLRALSSSGEELWRQTGFNACQTVGGNNPVALDRRRGRVYVCESAGDRIHAFTVDGRRIWRIDGVPADTLAVDEKTGDLWCSGGGRLDRGETVVFDSSGNEKATFFHRALDLAYDPSSDSFWLTGYHVISMSREGEIRFREKVDGWCCPSLAVNPVDGSVWLIERDHGDIADSANRLWVRDADGSVRRKIDLGDRGVFSVACDPRTGEAWIGIYGSGLRRYSGEGELIEELKLEGRYAAVSPTTGDLWINTEEAVLRIDSSGKVLARSDHEGESSQAWIAAF